MNGSLAGLDTGSMDGYLAPRSKAKRAALFGVFGYHHRTGSKTAHFIALSVDALADVGVNVTIPVRIISAVAAIATRQHATMTGPFTFYLIVTLLRHSREFSTMT